MADQNRLKILLDGYRSGNLSDSDLAEFRLLVARMQPEEWEQLSESFDGEWEKAGRGEHFSTAFLSDKEEMYQRILKTGAEASTVPLRPANKKWWIAAAAILLVIASGIWYFLPDSSVNNPETGLARTPEQVLPGVNKAILTLADGTTIVLDSVSEGSNTRQGTSIVSFLNGELAYKETGNTSDARVFYNTVSTPKGGIFQLTLPDGSKVWLNAASSITFPTAFDGVSRQVTMTGEAYFEVKRNRAMPFIVKVNDMDIEVLGTHFNVCAYTDEALMKTTLLEGSVKVKQADHSGILKPGEQCAVSESYFVVGTGNPELAVAWKNGYFQFNQSTLPEIMRQIGRWYDLDIRYKGKAPDRLFAGKIQRSLPLSGILNLLEKGDIRFSLEGRVLTVLE